MLASRIKNTYSRYMTTQTTDKVLLKRLIEELGNRGQAQLEIGADISRSTIRDMLKGYLPSQPVREKVAAFFGRKENELFPHIKSNEEAA